MHYEGMAGEEKGNFSVCLRVISFSSLLTLSSLSLPPPLSLSLIEAVIMQDFLSILGSNTTTGSLALTLFL